MKTTCLIVDDEPLARKLIASHVTQIDSLEVVGEFGLAVDAANFLRRQKVDLLFLDIQMPGITGLQLAETLRNPPAIILTTAYRNFAPEAFELEVVDYLLKPISFERLMKAVNRYFDRKAVGPTPFEVREETEPYVFIKSDRKHHRVLLQSIVYLESLDDYVKVHLDQEILVTRENISSLDDKLSPSGFVRIHRSFLINARQVRSIGAESVTVGSKELPFGRSFKKSAMARLSQ